ncbi:MAG: ASCH domain-containing protein [Armatimonadota bacterium]|jgi:predicted transcriptional regulator
MAPQTSEAAIVLLALHPRYAEAIFNGNKKVEFRRRSFRREVSHVVIYSTKPVAGITGVFSVEAVEKAPPAQLWARYADVAGLSESSFLSYYHGAESGVAIEVGDCRALDHPVDLSALPGDVCAPQSFRYITQDELPLELRSLL